jgi:thiol-disulfide isomerase/thioredoxin
MRAHRFTLGLALAAGLIVLAFGVLRAEEPQNAEKPKLKLNRDAAAKAAAAEKKKEAAQPKADDADDADDKADDKEAKEDRFAVPEGDVKKLLAFLQEMVSFRPKTREEFLEYRQKGQQAMKEAAEKIKQIATDEDQKLPGYNDVDGVLLYARSQDREHSPEDRKQLLDDLKSYFADNPEPSKYAVYGVQQLGSTMEYSANPQDAIPLYRELGPLLASSSTEEFARVGQKMEGAVRRLELPGNFMEISGRTVDGAQFEWSKYRGKVVLVDFWATWCGPCIGELPNVRKNYDLYHDKGFDVVGISLDSDAKRLEDFVKNESLPWTTIYEGGGWDTPMAVHYGINSIPRAILVDKEGKVVSMSARGPELGKQLADLLGPAEPAETEEKTSDAEKSDAKDK